MRLRHLFIYFYLFIYLFIYLFFFFLITGKMMTFFVRVFVLQTLSKNHLSHLMTKTNNAAVLPAKTQISLGIRVFAVRMKKYWILSYPLNAQRRLWSDWAHSHFVGFVMRRLIMKRNFDSQTAWNGGLCNFLSPSEIEHIRGFQCYHNKTGSYLKSFPGDKTVFYGFYLTLFMFVLMQFSLSTVRTWYYNILSIYLYILSQPRKEDIRTGVQRHRAKKKERIKSRIGKVKS